MNDRPASDIRGIECTDVRERPVHLADFAAYMPMHNYIFKPTREPWPVESVNARVPPVPLLDAQGEPVLDEKGKPILIKASTWLDQNSPVEQMTWSPGEPMLIRDRIIAQGGWIARPGCVVFNLYREPNLEYGDAGGAGPWLDHVRKIYPNDADHILRVLAHRVQRPQEKINHALVLGGAPGIGKDTLLEPVKRAVGHWNVQEISPRDLLDRWTYFIKSVILRVNEARDLGDIDRYALYDHMKPIIAAPPDVLPINEKYLRQYYVPNCTLVIITTNHKVDGLYPPADDRRHYIAWSDLTRDDFPDGYWNQMYEYYDNGGAADVAAYLASFDLTSFDPKAPPLKTEAFWAIADANRSAEDGELADVLDELGQCDPFDPKKIIRPDAITLARVQNKAPEGFREFLGDRKNRRVMPHRFHGCGYVPVRNPDAEDGLWVIQRKRQVIYAKVTLTLRKQLEAARELTKEGRDQSDQYSQ